ncbi:uncharacterized protein [Solanum lycopersicum]|uniref:uncharacterized protein n=1 Tax=Solanum lycopersicum TaxID=4081 RepID=UPI000532F0E0|nr:uncharacterized protein LOC104649319 [Solanum lycopersicum]
MPVSPARLIDAEVRASLAQMAQAITMQAQAMTAQMRKAKVEEFINLKQGSMTVREYSLNFVNLSRYATYLVSNNIDEMSWFVTGKNRNLEDEYRFAMLHDNMDLSRFMVHVQQVEDNRKNRGFHDIRRPTHQDQAGPSHGGHRNNFGVREKPSFKKG